MDSMRVNPNLSARAQGVWYPQPQLRLRSGCIAQRSDYATIWRGRVFKDFGVVKLYGSTDAVGDTFVQRGSPRISTNDQDTVTGYSSPGWSPESRLKIGVLLISERLVGDKVQTSVSTAKGLKYGNLADEGFPGGSWRTDH